MELFAPPVERLIEEFAKLPGIGQKTAQRLAFHVLDLPKEDAERFADAIREAKAKTFTCKRCQNLTDSEICPICSDKTRNQKVICVVAEPRDVIAFERTKEYKGLYHVLHGTLSPMGHVGPDDIRIRELVKRVRRRRRPRRLSSPPIRTPRAKPRRCTFRGCCSRSASRLRGWRMVFRLAGIWSLLMR